MGPRPCLGVACTPRKAARARHEVGRGRDSSWSPVFATARKMKMTSGGHTLVTEGGDARIGPALGGNWLGQGGKANAREEFEELQQTSPGGSKDRVGLRVEGVGLR
jgi:hypothetical protein